MDSYSYQCGVMDAFNEVVGAGVKSLALSHPIDNDDPYLSNLIQYAQTLTTKYNTKMYIEKSLLTTDLFPKSDHKDKTIILFYKNNEVLQNYLLLEKQKEELILMNQYHGENRKNIAICFGRMLSYSEDKIELYLSSNLDKE